MNNTLYTLFLTFFLFFTCANTHAQDVPATYKMVQGLGYLHTQTTMLIDHWKWHPINHKPMDDHERQIQKHFIEELEHDEEWAEYIMVEDNLFYMNLEEPVEEAIAQNIQFYQKVLNEAHDPDKVDLKAWKKELKAADNRMYTVIFPALFK